MELHLVFLVKRESYFLMRFMVNEDWFTVGGRGVGWIISTYEYKEGFIDSDAYKTYKTYALQNYSDVSNIERPENIRSTFCKLSQHYFMLSFGASDRPPFFAMQLNFEETILSNWWYFLCAFFYEIIGEIGAISLVISCTREFPQLPRYPALPLENFHRAELEFGSIYQEKVDWF